QKASTAAWSASTVASSPTRPRPSAAPSRAAWDARGAPRDSSSSWRPSTSRRPGDAAAAATDPPTIPMQEAGELMSNAQRDRRSSRQGRKVRAAAATTLVVLTLAACGGGGDNDADADDGTGDA